MLRRTRRPLYRAFGPIALSFACWTGFAQHPAAVAGPPVAELTPADEEPELSDAGLDASTAEHGPVGETEIIQERYPNRAVKVERSVAQDPDGNYFNHGLWTMWDQEGRIMGTGEYRHGERHGTWTRSFDLGEGPMYSQQPYKQFEAPFVSEATFVNGRLHGVWTVYDNRQRKISEWDFQQGELHGRSTWWLPSGQKLREIDYRKGQIDGEVKEWGPKEELILKESYVNGRRMAKKTETYPTGETKSEGQYIWARPITKSNFDWWAGIADIQLIGKQGKDRRDGPWTSWYKSGQKQYEGNYEDDQRSGTFTWWHPNGQKAIQGSYVDDRQDGKWTWWFANGQKQIQGEYSDGRQIGKWSWWGENGKVLEAANLSEKSGPPAPVGRQANIDSKPGPLLPPANIPESIENALQTKPFSSYYRQ